MCFLCALILSETLALCKSFTYLLTYKSATNHEASAVHVYGVCGVWRVGKFTSRWKAHCRYRNQRRTTGLQRALSTQRTQRTQRTQLTQQPKRKWSLRPLRLLHKRQYGFCPMQDTQHNY